MPAEAGDTPSDSTPVLLTGPRFADASIERAGIGALVSREVSRALDPGAPETPEIAPLPGERDVAHDAEAADRESDTPLGEGIDEDRLRDLVAELVRQELQGVLGERITRNVRKLVRREIHRVLLSHEAE
jgi:cell pole-organizing protein PopZ